MSDLEGQLFVERMRVVNRAGRLYPPPASGTFEEIFVCELVRCGLVVPVPATPTSPRGYVAVGVCGIAWGLPLFQS